MAAWINEFHYDNAGTDVDEFIEIAGPAGTDLTGWTVVLYNGGNGNTYGNPTTLSGVLQDQNNGFGFYRVNFPTDGLQNGSPDGFALVDAGGNVIQFLSYEGSFVANNGPAAGMTSVGVGVEQSSSTPAGLTLQLTGTGSQYSDFTWSATPLPRTWDEANEGQFFTPPGPSLSYSGTIRETDPLSGELVSTVVITVSGDTFAGEAGDMLDVQFSNVPDGLAFEVVKLTDTTAELRVTGAATAHANADDVADFGIAFQNGAFTGGDAGAIANASRNNLVIDFTDPPEPGAALPYEQTFDNRAGFDEFVVFSLDTDQNNTWYYSTGEGAAEVNAFGDTAPANDWLISRAFNLDETTVEFLSFRTWTNFTDSGVAQPLRLLYSTDYAGEGDPSAAQWQPLSFTASPSNSQQWTDSGQIDLSGIDGQNVHFAFQYQSSGTGSNSSSSWRVDDFKIESYTGTVLAIQADDATRNEGAAGEETEFTFIVTRAGDTDVALDVDWTVSGTGAQPAAADDFAGGAYPTGTLSFAAGETSKTITVKVLGDGAAEANETFAVTLSGATAGASIIGATAQGTILNDDGEYTTKIHQIQGNAGNWAVDGSSSTASPMLGSTVTIEGLLTGFAAGLNGFYVQEEAADHDDDAGTSEGIFVYYGSMQGVIDWLQEAEAGHKVRLTGTVAEYNGQTQLTSISSYQIQDGGTIYELPEPVVVTLPVESEFTWEAVEGMLVEVRSGTTGGRLVITDNFDQARFGQLTLTSDELLQQFTEGHAPDVDAYRAWMAEQKLDQIILDDGSSRQNPDRHLGRGGEPLSADNPLRAGDWVESVVGIVDQFVDSAAAGHQTSYRIQPVTETPAFQGAERPTAEDFPDAIRNAEIKVASTNVLNYFTTLGSGPFETSAGNTQTGRGATNAAEFERQHDKIVAQLLEMDADVLGLMEIQNDTGATLQYLVDALNNSAQAQANGDVYDYVRGDADGNLPSTGTDAITIAVIYKTNKVTPEGFAATADPAQYDAFSPLYGNRVPLAQTFRSNESDELFTVVVNHFKSKGSPASASGNEDLGDGQGASNASRVRAAEQLAAWLETDPTGSGDSDVLLLGDFNAYGREDPVRALEESGYGKVSNGYSYSFDGLWGSLDHIFATESAQQQIAGVYKWGINAEESTLLDYNQEYKTAEQREAYYSADPYRSSDHNPILVGLNLGGGQGGPGQPGGPGEPGGPGQPSDPIVGGDEGGELVGTDGNDVIRGGTGRDIIRPGAGDDAIDGGDGLDYVALTGPRATYEITFGENGEISISGADGVKALENVERVLFEDTLLAFDIDGAAGQAYRLYQAAFDRAPDTGGVSYWTLELDEARGDINWLSRAFLESDEFTAAFGDYREMPDEAFVALMYQNVLGREGEAGGVAYWGSRLEDGMARENVLSSFSESQENVVNLAPLVAGGIALDPDLFFA